MTAIARNNVRMHGSAGKTMLFAHGFGGDQNMWRLVAPAFAHEYRIVVFDQVGAGRARAERSELAGYVSLERYADDLIAICDAAGLRDVVYVGHSVSAMIGVLAAIRRPDCFSRLVLIGPSPCYLNEPGYHGGFERQDILAMLEQLDANYLAWSRMMAPAIMGNLDRPELGAELTTGFCNFDPAFAKRLARLTFLSDNRGDLPRLRRPSLILQCTDDPIAPEPVGDYMHAHLPGSTLRKLRATGHCPNLSAPEETVEAIRAYLLDPGSEPR
ncbi:alpha/beta fold hydrolase [Caldimonas tepidiphila]|uniref:alpha/beta fold hydrolase n=1 Tax=Caldimonas tepidiphila TaxID=2315841 RepID=UPI000E5A151A|nr:alpha/beta hydrolase [Caldimonas tepidiphila]